MHQPIRYAINELFTAQGQEPESPIEMDMDLALPTALSAAKLDDCTLEREVEVGDYRVDFMVTLPNKWRIAVECDGYTFHYHSRPKILYDRKRDRFLIHEHVIPIHFMQDEIMENPKRCAAVVVKIIQQYL